MPFLRKPVFKNGTYPAGFFFGGADDFRKNLQFMAGQPTSPPTLPAPLGIAGLKKGLLHQLGFRGGKRYVARGKGPMIPISRLRSQVESNQELGSGYLGGLGQTCFLRKDWKFWGTNLVKFLVDIFVYI